MGGLFVIAGVTNSIVIGLLLDKYQRYLLSMRATCIFSAVLFACGYFAFTIKNNYVVGINVALDGAALIPFLPVCIAFAAEVTFPMQEAVVVGILQLMG